MPDDFFDTSHESVEIRIDDNRVRPGDDINLIQKDPTLKKMIIASGWDINVFDSEAPDLDLSIILIGKDGKTRVDEDFVFYNNPKDADGAVMHHGDSRTGAGDGDDETISVDLNKLPFDVVQILVILSIYKGDEKQQELCMVKNAFVRILNADTQIELLRYDLDDDLKDREETAMLAAEINRLGPKWHFKPVGELVEGGLRKIAMRYDLMIADQ